MENYPDQLLHRPRMHRYDSALCSIEARTASGSREKENGRRMNIIRESLQDPVWRIGVGTLVIVTLFLIVAVRTRHIHISPQQKHRETVWLLLGSFTVVVLISSGVVWQHASTAPLSGTPQMSPLPSTPTPFPSPTPTPSPEPSPTPSPSLARSITQVLTTFCEALDAKKYQTAWQQYSSQLQQAHPQAETFAAWRKFAHCRIPDQSADPSAWTILTLTLVDGQTEKGRIGDVEYRLTMRAQSNAWKITEVCQIMSEGCFAI